MSRTILLEAPQKDDDIGNLKYSSQIQNRYEYYDGNVSNEKESTPSSSLSISSISPLILLVIIVLAIIFFIYGLIHLVLWFLMKRSPPSSSLYNSNRFQESNHSRSLQRQLQQLFRLHDSGLDQALIDSLPIFYYQDLLGLKEPFDCAVCLCEFSNKDKLRLVPLCSHAFHMNCIDTWLLSNSTCPLCRAPLSTSTCPLENQILNMLRITNEEDNEYQHTTTSEFTFNNGRSKGLTEEEQISKKRVFSVRNNGLKGGDIGVVVESSSHSHSSYDVRRCYSMGSYQYMVADSNLQVVLSQLSQYERGSEVNGNVDGRKIENRTKGESFSVSKIWLWSKKSRYHSSSSSSYVVFP
ncbi:hypothetical protein Lal_00023718 [Lupinus albus]|uniref:RING-type E3 ubiquitin transferase n=1 Tax=Lupinus albus TaxID=3870 RepID=A0A6A4PJD6_LUPAL|nr:putative transcription factor C2H2 family [Lupinus albus]KAF1887711.1 hypothetical protein Lal_00023718 [Lupinus albus]